MIPGFAETLWRRLIQKPTDDLTLSLGIIEDDYCAPELHEELPHCGAGMVSHPFYFLDVCQPQFMAYIIGHASARRADQKVPQLEGFGAWRIEKRSMDLPRDPSSQVMDPQNCQCPIKDPTLMQPALKSDRCGIWQAETPLGGHRDQHLCRQVERQKREGGAQGRAHRQSIAAPAPLA